MIGAVAAGYFLMGLGVGLLTNGFLLDLELRRPVGEDEPIQRPSKVTETESKPSTREEAKAGLRIDLEGSQGYSNALNYGKYFDETENDGVTVNIEKSYEEKKAEEEHPVDDDEEEMIFPITEDEYVDAKSANYDKIDITFYEDDNTYADSATDTIATAFEDHIGTDPLEFDEDDMAYIRNENERADYAIHRVEVGYVEAVLGIADDEASDIPRGPRKMRKNDYD